MIPAAILAGSAAIARSNRRKNKTQTKAKGKSARAGRSRAVPANHLMVLSKPMTVKGVSRARNQGRSKGLLSNNSIEWLKNTFAAPDFEGLAPRGIPDNFSGRTLMKQFRSVGTYTGGGSNYILVPPIPGFKYFTNSAGDLAFQGTAYDDYSSLFGNNNTSEDDTVTSFRIVSNIIELVPTTNAMNWTGSISAYRVPIRMIDDFGPTAVVATVSGAPINVELPMSKKSLTGLDSVYSSKTAQYITPSHLGVYAVAVSDQSTFEFSEILSGYDTLPRSNTPDVPLHFRGDMGGIQGFGGMDTIVIKLNGVTSANSFIIKTWQTVEFTVKNTSALYDYAMISPPLDPVALQVYRVMSQACPLGVTYFENAKFWDTLLRLARQLAGNLSTAQGSTGLIAQAIASLLRPR